MSSCKTPRFLIEKILLLTAANFRGDYRFTSLSEVARNLEEYLSEFAQSKTAPNEEQHQRIQEKLNELFQVDIRREDIRRLGGED
ncbi:MAG: hypothetical protein A2063_05390 [Gallionellales bacterium GWA2_60_142]|jgi:hypothetical protein|nr:MAG: hypothetical protein A2063_05390 [Gallionellales bacterium GWA2_60_142]HCI14845.1 hypothetical protein [Gallionellaceae bacterium]